MPTTSGVVPPELDIFYILDTSGSMKGQAITQLNRAMISTIDELREEARHNRNARIRVAVLEFNTDCRWVTSYGPEYLEYFTWDDLEANGLTAVGKALDALNEKLTTTDRGGYVDMTHGALVPAFIFMTDGFANDDYQKALDKIRQNRWFNRGTRVGFAIGKNPDVEMIAKLTGSSEAVIRTEDLNIFTSLLKWVSVTTSVVASQTKGLSSRSKGVEAVNAGKSRYANENPGFDPDAVGVDYGYEEEPVKDRWGFDEVFGGDWDTDNLT